MTVKIATQVLRVVERELACGYSRREAFDRAACEFGLDRARVSRALGWLAANY